MPARINTLKIAFAEHRPLFGCWLGFADAYATELVATAPFDWLLIDGEHAPNDLPTITQQLAVLDSEDCRAIVRLPMDRDWAIKQVLDAGAQTLLIPLVDTAEQARRIVAACRYPPQGIRGSGAMLARATQFGNTEDYLTTANDQICILVQAETRAAMRNLESIAAVEGIDGIFIGPSDLANDMGFTGRGNAPEVQEAIHDGLRRIRATGKAAGVMCTDESKIDGYIDSGATFLAIGVDVTLLADAVRGLAGRWVGTR